MDFIVNGYMKGESEQLVRDGGIIVSHTVKIYDGGIEMDQGGQIHLYEFDNEPSSFMGRFYVYPEDNPVSLLFDKDFITNNGNERRVLPQGASEAPIQEPYGIEILFSRDPNDPLLIGVDLTLQQQSRARNLNVRMHSAVYLRNWEP